MQQNFHNHDVMMWLIDIRC